MGYPTSVFSPTTKNNGDTIQASHINDLQTEITAIETAALNGSWTVPNQPRMHAVATGGQSFSSSQSTGIRIAYGQVYHDIGSGWSTTTNQYTVPSSGTYLLHASLALGGGNPDGALGIYVDNSTTPLVYDYVSTLGHPNQILVNTRLETGSVVHFAFTGNSTATRGSVGAQVSRVSIVKLC